VVPHREVNLALAPSLLISTLVMRSSQSLRHLTRYECSAPACVLRIATVETTADETEAVHRRRSRSYADRVTRYGKASRGPRRQSYVGHFLCALVFHCNVVHLPAERQPNFGQTRAPVFLVANGWPLPKWTHSPLFWT
jgi:hypothetical protein